MLFPKSLILIFLKPVSKLSVIREGFLWDGLKKHGRSDLLLNLLGLGEKRDTPSGRLSGGMKRRLMIARALVHNPKVLILDEPTAGVDISLRRSMWDFMLQQNEKGLTIILTTHYLEEAESLCEKIAIIDEGILLKMGQPIHFFRN